MWVKMSRRMSLSISWPTRVIATVRYRRQSSNTTIAARNTPPRISSPVISPAGMIWSIMILVMYGMDTAMQLMKITTARMRNTSAL